MKIIGFDITNFKGIRKAKIKFSDNDQARVHTLVGLNESGKTTLLEAIHSFSPDAETELVVKSIGSAEKQREQWIPRDQISLFSDDVSVTAYVRATPDELENLMMEFREQTSLTLQNNFPCDFTIKLVHRYQNGDYVECIREIGFPSIRAKTARAKNYRDLNRENQDTFYEILFKQIPTVAYYPTFVFDFPERIYLTDRDNSPKNRFYRQLFQDILDYDGNGYTIEDSILARIHREETQGPWETWFSAFVGTSEEDKVKQVISRAERVVTRVVFSKWNEVFGEETGAKEIAIDLQYEKGLILEHDDGTEEEPEEHDAYIRFRVKDGANIYYVEDRSLGFRWFFSFLLFTQFRIHREKQKPTIFLFDEPASNLHAAAQTKLLESFPAIAKAPHRLVYSTHSHYMVEPKWLEQAYIVFDRSADTNGNIIDTSVHEDSAVDIQIVPYRKFVHEYPTQTSYFQPILDTLEVQPSKFDLNFGGLIVEGKADYYFIKFAESCCGVNIGPIFPAGGSGTMGTLVSLHKGWGLRVRVVLDSDRGGKDGKKNLCREFSLEEHEVTLLSNLAESISKIEDIISTTDKKSLVVNHSTLTKTALLRRVQEFLASNEVPRMDKETLGKMEILLKAIQEFSKDKEIK